VPLVSVTYNPWYPFHGGNTGSNPVGDANNLKDLLESGFFAEGLKGFDKKESRAGRAFFPHLFAGKRIILTSFVCAARFIGVTVCV
jgi:hypothetical protein